jgi:hypothetical protein
MKGLSVLGQCHVCSPLGVGTIGTVRRVGCHHSVSFVFYTRHRHCLWISAVNLQGVRVSQSCRYRHQATADQPKTGKYGTLLLVYMVATLVFSSQSGDAGFGGASQQGVRLCIYMYAQLPDGDRPRSRYQGGKEQLGRVHPTESALEKVQYKAYGGCRQTVLGRQI